MRGNADASVEADLGRQRQTSLKAAVVCGSGVACSNSQQSGTRVPDRHDPGYRRHFLILPQKGIFQVTPTIFSPSFPKLDLSFPHSKVPRRPEALESAASEQMIANRNYHTRSLSV